MRWLPLLLLSACGGALSTDHLPPECRLPRNCGAVCASPDGSEWRATDIGFIHETRGSGTTGEQQSVGVTSVLCVIDYDGNRLD